MIPGPLKKKREQIKTNNTSIDNFSLRVEKTYFISAAKYFVFSYQHFEHLMYYLLYYCIIVFIYFWWGWGGVIENHGVTHCH